MDLGWLAGLASDPVVKAWMAMMAVAFLLALLASMPPRRPASSWMGDMFVRWGIAGLFVWFVVNGLWAVREVVGQKFIVPFSPIEGYLEHATVWGAVLTGMATMLFFGSSLFLRAIFAREEIPKGIMYYRMEVMVSSPEAQRAREARRPAAVAVDRRAGGARGRGSEES